MRRDAVRAIVEGAILASASSPSWTATDLWKVVCCMQYPMRSSELKHGVIALLLAVVTITAGSVRGLCLNQRTSPDCCAGKGQGTNTRSAGSGANNCCAVSHSDDSQPATATASSETPGAAHVSATRIGSRWLWSLPSNYPLSAGLGRWLHKVRHLVAVPALTCALLM